MLYVNPEFLVNDGIRRSELCFGYVKRGNSERISTDERSVTCKRTSERNLLIVLSSDVRLKWQCPGQ
jgi:hypothetical protein